MVVVVDFTSTPSIEAATAVPSATLAQSTVTEQYTPDTSGWARATVGRRSRANTAMVAIRTFSFDIHPSFLITGNCFSEG